MCVCACKTRSWRAVGGWIFSSKDETETKKRERWGEDLKIRTLARLGDDDDKTDKPERLQ